MAGRSHVTNRRSHAWLTVAGRLQMLEEEHHVDFFTSAPKPRGNPTVANHNFGQFPNSKIAPQNRNQPLNTSPFVPKILDFLPLFFPPNPEMSLSKP
jgi:hypothetical protein